MKVTPEEIYASLGERALKSLTYRERQVLKLRYGLGIEYQYTRQDVAHIFKVTSERIRQIEDKALHKLHAKALHHAKEINVETR